MIVVWTNNAARYTETHVIDISSYPNMDADAAEVILRASVTWKGRVLAAGNMTVRSGVSVKQLENVVHLYTLQRMLQKIAHGTRGRANALKDQKEHVREILERHRLQCVDHWTGQPTRRTTYYNEGVRETGKWFEVVYGSSPFSGPFPDADDKDDQNP